MLADKLVLPLPTTVDGNSDFKVVRFDGAILIAPPDWGPLAHLSAAEGIERLEHRFGEYTLTLSKDTPEEEVVVKEAEPAPAEVTPPVAEILSEITADKKPEEG